MLYRVVCHHFVAGFVVENNRVTKAAPILNWLLGMHITQAITRLRYRRYEFERLT